MIDFSRAQLTHYILHGVGNKGLGEELTLTKNLISFTDDFVKETILRYFLTPFKTDVYHQFKGKIDISLASVANCCEDIFKSREKFVELSNVLATHLYNQSMHPKIPGGELHICFFKDAVCDGELVDAIGLFKSERQETFIKLESNQGFEGYEYAIETQAGIDIRKLDKGSLNFNTDKENGYKMSIIDTNNKVAECALYWEEDFLNAKIKTNAYYHTSNFINTARGFCEEILTEVNNVEKEQQMMMLNKSVSFFQDKENFDLKEFEKEVLSDSEVIDAFKEYRDDYNKRLDIVPSDKFEVSETAVKKNKKYMKSVIKLDKNFHLFVHSKHEYLEKGFDEERGLKFYKVFFVNETV